MLVSIVIPCYNSEDTIGQVVDLCMEEFDKLDGYELEMILVNDFSSDRTYEVIRECARKYPNVKGISLAKNFGQHSAIMAGLHETNGEYIMGMDDDMQTHPSQIKAFLDAMEQGADVVFGVYRKRKFSFMKNLTSKIAGFITWHMVERPKGLEASNFWCCRRYVRDEVILYTGYNLYLQILFFRTTHNIVNIPVDHFERASGASNYNFRKLFRLFMSFMDYSLTPLRIATVLGSLFSVVGFICALIVVIRKILDPTIQVGWTSLFSLMLVLFGILFLMIGVIGEYVGKIILNVNRMPQYVIRETCNIEPQKASAGTETEQIREAGGKNQKKNC